jgi:hypothetical protein
MIRRLAFMAFLVTIGLNPTARAGMPATTGDASRVNVSLSAWQSTGNITWSHDASAFEPLFGNPTSRLEYDKVDSTIVELRARIELTERLFVELAYGAGDVDSGRLTDTDFVSASGARAFGTTVAGPHAYSETISILDGDSIHFIDARLGREFFRSPDHRSRAGLAARYLDWTEKFSARGVLQTVCTAPGRLCLPQGTFGFVDREVIYNDARWRALFIGAWGRHRVNERLTLSGELSLSPFADLSSDDRHALRSDLASDPSFRLTGQGRAATAGIEAAYHFNPRLAASIGVRYWWMEVRNEARGFTAFPADGAPFSSKLNSFESERYGVTLSLSYALGAINSHRP